MSDLHHQLELLRAKLARIDRKYQNPDAHDLTEGQEVETEAGKHWEITRSWPASYRHGTADVGALSELPADHLDTPSPPSRWVFLDTETTGLAGGSGTVPFLVGVGWITPSGFELRQFFMRDHGEEASLLTGLSRLLANFDWMVTYNGRAFDQPLLETRYRLARISEPFPRLQHLDLLYNSRRLWKLRLENCRLQQLEQRILNVERHGDVEGALIPEIYFHYLHTRDATRLEPVLYHNAIDILSLACLTAIVPMAFKEPQTLTQATEMIGLARWLRNEGRLEEALDLMRRAIHRPLPDELLYHTLWHIAEIERKLDREPAAVALWSELSTIANPWQAKALERLAIYYEHRERNYAMALEMTLQALKVDPTEDLLRRHMRLSAKATTPKSGRLL